jgi:hypothetical protein
MKVMFSFVFLACGTHPAAVRACDGSIFHASA